MTGTGEVNRSRVTISNEKGSFTFVHYESGYNMLYGERDDGTDIFISAILDAQIVGTGISFEDYCEENGYDEDGKELAKKTYDGLMKANTKLRSMFEDDVYSHLCRLAEETV